MPTDDEDRPRLDDEDRAAETMPESSPRVMETATQASERVREVRSRMYPAIYYLRDRFAAADIEPDQVVSIVPELSNERDELRLRVRHHLAHDGVRQTTVAVSGEECLEHGLTDIRAIVAAYPFAEFQRPTPVDFDPNELTVTWSRMEPTGYGRRRAPRVSVAEAPVLPGHTRLRIAGGGYIDERSQIEDREEEARLCREQMRRMRVEPVVMDEDVASGDLRIRIQRCIFNPAMSVGPAWLMRSTEIRVDRQQLGIVRDLSGFGVQVFSDLTRQWQNLYGEEPLLAFSCIDVDLTQAFADLWARATRPSHERHVFRGEMTSYYITPPGQLRERAREANRNWDLPLPDDRAKDAEGNYVRAKAGRDPWAQDHEVIDLNTGLVVANVVEVDCVAGWADVLLQSPGDQADMVPTRIWGKFEITPTLPRDRQSIHIEEIDE